MASVYQTHPELANAVVGAEARINQALGRHVTIEVEWELFTQKAELDSLQLWGSFFVLDMIARVVEDIASSGAKAELAKALAKVHLKNDPSHVWELYLERKLQKVEWHSEEQTLMLVGNFRIGPGGGPSEAQLRRALRGLTPAFTRQRGDALCNEFKTVHIPTFQAKVRELLNWETFTINADWASFDAAPDTELVFKRLVFNNCAASLQPVLEGIEAATREANVDAHRIRNVLNSITFVQRPDDDLPGASLLFRGNKVLQIRVPWGKPWRGGDRPAYTARDIRDVLVTAARLGALPAERELTPEDQVIKTTELARAACSLSVINGHVGYLEWVLRHPCFHQADDADMYACETFLNAQIVSPGERFLSVYFAPKINERGQEQDRYVLVTTHNIYTFNWDFKDCTFESKRVHRMPHADFHAVRIGELIAKDKKKQQTGKIGMSFVAAKTGPSTWVPVSDLLWDVITKIALEQLEVAEVRDVLPELTLDGVPEYNVPFLLYAWMVSLTEAREPMTIMVPNELGESSPMKLSDVLNLLYQSVEAKHDPLAYDTLRLPSPLPARHVPLLIACFEALREAGGMRLPPLGDDISLVVLLEHLIDQLTGWAPEEVPRIPMPAFEQLRPERMVELLQAALLPTTSTATTEEEIPVRRLDSLAPSPRPSETVTLSTPPAPVTGRPALADVAALLSCVAAQVNELPAITLMRPQPLSVLSTLKTIVDTIHTFDLPRYRVRELVFGGEAAVESRGAGSMEDNIHYEESLMRPFHVGGPAMTQAQERLICMEMGWSIFAAARAARAPRYTPIPPPSPTIYTPTSTAGSVYNMVSMGSNRKPSNAARFAQQHREMLRQQAIAEQQRLEAAHAEALARQQEAERAYAEAAAAEAKRREEEARAAELAAAEEAEQRAAAEEAYRKAAEEQAAAGSPVAPAEPPGGALYSAGVAPASPERTPAATSDDAAPAPATGSPEAPKEGSPAKPPPRAETPEPAAAAPQPAVSPAARPMFGPAAFVPPPMIDHDVDLLHTAPAPAASSFGRPMFGPTTYVPPPIDDFNPVDGEF